MINAKAAVRTHNLVTWTVVALLGVSCSVFSATPSVDSAKSMAEVLKTVKASGAKVILLNVWATDCSPCMAEMPVLVQVGEKFKSNKDVAFVGLCLPADAAVKKGALAVATAIVKKKEIPYPNLVWLGTAESLQDKFDIQGTPYNVLLSPDGKILSEVEVPENAAKAAEVLSGAIEKALKNIPAK